MLPIFGSGNSEHDAKTEWSPVPITDRALVRYHSNLCHHPVLVTLVFWDARNDLELAFPVSLPRTEAEATDT